MRRFIVGLNALICAVSTSAAAAADTNPLIAERWKTRPVVVFAPSADDALLKQVDAAWNQASVREDFEARDMVLYSVIEGQGRRNDTALSPEQTQAMLAALSLNAKSQATLLLLGLDGNVKVQQSASADLKALFPVVDAMPMRRNSPSR